MPCSPGKIWSWVSSETLDLKHPSPPSHHRSPIKPTLAWLVMQSFPDHSITQIRWTRHASGLSSVQSLSHVWLFGTPWTAARQASLSITNSQSLPKLMSIESLMPSNHLILCCLLLLLPASGSFQMSPFFSSSGQGIGVSSSALVLPMNTQDWSRLGWISLQSKGLSRVFSNTTVQKYQFFGTLLSL